MMSERKKLILKLDTMEKKLHYHQANAWKHQQFLQRTFKKYEAILMISCLPLVFFALARLKKINFKVAMKPFFEMLSLVIVSQLKTRIIRQIS